MRGAVTASIVVHFGLIAGALVALNWPETFDPASVESISVDLVTLEEFTSTAVSETQSNALENMLAVGAETVAPSEAQPVEPVRVAEVTPVTQQAVAEADPVQPANAEPARAATPPSAEAVPIDPIEVASAAVLAAVPAAAVPVEGILPDKPSISAQAVAITPQTATTDQQPVRVADVTPGEVQPVDAPRQTVVTAVEPVEPDPPPKEPPKEAPKDPPKKKPKKQATPPPSAPGSGGNSNANQQASVQSGGQGQSDAAGNAAVSKYPGQVQAKLRRALRYPAGAGRLSGEVRVQFVVAASGSVSGIKVVGSSGNNVLDQAALATVKRAAPFPPIPPASGKSTWTFVIPLMFQR